MYIFLVLIFLVAVLVTLILRNKKATIEEKDAKKINICKHIIVLNICIVCFITLVLPGIGGHITNPLIIFMVSLIISVIAIVLLFNKKIANNTIGTISVLVIYFLIMFVIPVYKFENHEHVFNNNHETIREYTDYYNCYLMKIYKEYKWVNEKW